ncbi:MAG TPA: hypothetical protein VFQ44_08845 [Streptosporangiaceae bacterium]|nr:hypothetical protein [Streptosporangiaceae bacterium]
MLAEAGFGLPGEAGGAYVGAVALVVAGPVPRTRAGRLGFAGVRVGGLGALGDDLLPAGEYQRRGLTAFGLAG